MIETPRLRLIPCEPRHFEAILAADRGRLGRMLGVAVPDDGLDFSGTASTETIRSLH